MTGLSCSAQTEPLPAVRIRLQQPRYVLKWPRAARIAMNHTASVAIK